MRPTCVTCATKAMYILRACRTERRPRPRSSSGNTRGSSFGAVIHSLALSALVTRRHGRANSKFLQTTITHATRPCLAPLRLARDDCRWPSVPRMQLGTFRDGRFRAAALFLLPPEFAYICACLANVLARPRPPTERRTRSERPNAEQ